MASRTWRREVDLKLPANRRFLTLKLRSFGRVLPLVFALVDPWWTLRTCVNELTARGWIVTLWLGRKVAGFRSSRPD
jgi:hypothetical protein